MQHKVRFLTVNLLLVSALLVGQAVLAQSPRGEDRPYRAPAMPVILDGVEFAAGELPSAYQPRIFVITSEDQEKGVVHAFSSEEWAKAFLQLTMARTGSEKAACQHPYNFSVFNKNRGGGGSDNLYMDFDPYTSDPAYYPNLDFGGWNNTISWVAAACIGAPTAIYSCRDFEMQSNSSCQDPARYFVSSGTIITDLVPYGFNNRTSSIKFGF